MRQKIMPGGVVDFVTPDELVAMIPRPRQVTRIRETAQVQLSAAGAGTCEVYTIPTGYSFEAHRVTLELTAATPNSGQILLSAAGVVVAYQRSGTLIEYALTQGPNGYQIPGIQTWSHRQGPYLRNKETFEVAAQGLTDSAILTVVLEGELIRPAEGEMA